MNGVFLFLQKHLNVERSKKNRRKKNEENLEQFTEKLLVSLRKMSNQISVLNIGR